MHHVNNISFMSWIWGSTYYTVICTRLTHITYIVSFSAFFKWLSTYLFKLKSFPYFSFIRYLSIIYSHVVFLGGWGKWIFLQCLHSTEFSPVWVLPWLPMEMHGWLSLILYVYMVSPLCALTCPQKTVWSKDSFHNFPYIESFSLVWIPCIWTS